MKKWKTKALLSILFAFSITMFFVIVWYSRINRNYSEQIELADGWTIKVNSDVYEDVNLNDFHIPFTMRGDWLVLTNKFPEDMIKNPTMRLHMIFCVTDVYIDGEKIYEFGMSEYKENKLLGYGTRFVSLPEDCAGKTIKITLSVTENNAFSTLTPITIYDESAYYQSFLGNLAIPLVVSVSLIVIGICISIVTFCLFFKDYSMERLFCIGVFSLCIGCWTLCSYNLDMVFTSSLRVKTYLEYLSLYLVCFPLLLYFREDVEQRGKRWESFFFYALLLIEIQMYVITFVLHMLNVAHFPVFVRPFQALMVLTAILVFILIIQDMKNRKMHSILLIGVIVLFIAAAHDLIVFDVIKYFQLGGAEGNYHSYVCIGALLFVVSMLADFINEMRKRMYVNAETEFYIKIAYVDVLTDLNTRRKIEEIFAQVEKRNYEYAIIQFDLNNLKNTNDTLGHEKGDELITRFADLLRKIYCHGETLGRMGGDEFIAVITDAYDYDVSKSLRELDAAIAEDNEKHEDVKVSVSYGYARSSEFEKPTTRDVYMTADRRMYVHKEMYYKLNGRGRRKYDET